MENVYDVRYKKNLYYILPGNIRKNLVKHDSVAIFVCLFYSEKVDLFLDYLSRIPRDIDIYIAFSNDEIAEKVRDFFRDKCNVTVIRKENTGRDVSALLVTFRNIILKYRYICFVHDKKIRVMPDDEIWIKNLWGNTVYSAEFIDNVISLLENTENIGLLVPPEPIGDTRNRWCKNTWAKNYENTVALAKRLNLKDYCIEPTKPSFTLGTIFWCKVDALQTLFTYHWKYNDFMEEPLPKDGTLSHAVERILAYVAQDAGYDTGIIMSDVYAQWHMCYLQNRLNGLFENMDENIFAKLQSKKIMKAFCENHKRIYLFGAGKVAEDRYNMLCEIGKNIDGVIVSDKSVNENFHNLSIIEVCEIKKKWGIGDGVIIGVGIRYKTEVIDLLREMEVSDNDILSI